MCEQFAVPIESERNEERVLDSPAESIDRIAGTTAERSAKTVQRYNKDNSKLFSK